MTIGLSFYTAMVQKQILIVEDDQPIREMVAFGLTRAGFGICEAEDCQAARLSLAARLPDLMLLDWMLPDMSGLEFARALRRDQVMHDLPIIMLTARAEEHDRIRGLDSGADDYITKPFSARELLARINAVLRRVAGAEDVVRADALALNAASHRVTVEDAEIALGPTEYRLLKFLMTHPERVYSRGQVLDYVWGANVYVEERTVDVHVRRLRKALAARGYDGYIQTVRGAGYRFSPARANG